MKNFKLLLTFALCLTFGLSYGQIKVVAPDGNTVIGNEPNSDPGQANLKSYGTSELEFALDAGTGNADFTMQVLGQTKAQFKYNIAQQGVQILCDAASTGDFGLPGGVEAMFISGANQNIGIGTNTPAFKLDVQGSIGMMGNMVATSDRRLKQNVTDFEYGLDAVMALRPINYQFNGKANSNTEEAHVGLFAQDLQAIAPALVNTWTYTEYAKQSADDIANEKSEIISVQEDYLNINETAIKYMLVNAVQEQQATIEALEAKIAKIESAMSNNGSSTQTIEVTSATLAQNAPNPFNKSTRINYSVPADASNATLQVFDINGAQLKSISIAKGNGEVTLEAGSLAAGTYTYNLVVDGVVVDTKQMVLTK